MDRRRFFQVPAVGSAIAATGIVATGDEGSGQPIAIGQPAAVAPRSDGIEIAWRVSQLAKGHVEFGESEKLGNLARGDAWGLRPAGKEVIRVRIDDLKPGTTYFYRTVTETFDTKVPRPEMSAIRRFTTLAPNRDTTTFAVWNDTHKNNETIARLGAITPPSDFLLWNGDISNDWNQEGDVAESTVTPGGAEVDVTAETPLLVLRGNHDLRGRLAHQMEDYVATPSGKPWFAFRSGPLAAICMDTGEDKPDDHPHLFDRVACEPMRREQAEWLEEVIRQPEIKEAPYRILFCHIPLRWTDEARDYGYDYFSKRSRDLWHDSLVKWNAQLVISGHIHEETYLEATDEFPYAQLIGGGPGPGNARLITGRANAESLALRVTDLAGDTTREIALRALT